MTYGVNHILADEYGSHMILRHHAVLELLTDIMKSERLFDETKEILDSEGCSVRRRSQETRQSRTRKCSALMASPEEAGL